MHNLDGLQQGVLILGWSRSCVSVEAWLKQPHCALQEFLVAEGKQLEDGTRDDPTLDRFEAEIAKYRAVQEEIQALPTSATIGYIKIDAKPIKQALTTWVTKWIYLFTHYLQIKVTSCTLLLSLACCCQHCSFMSSTLSYPSPSA